MSPSKTHWPSIYVSTLVAFIGAIHQNSVMVWPYLRQMDQGGTNETFFGVLGSTSGLGTFVSAMLAGLWTNRRGDTKPAMVAGKVLALVSCSLYLCIELVAPDQFRVHLLFVLFELLLGLSVGAAAMWRTHVAHASTEQDRPRAVGICSLAPAIGLCVGPMVNVVLSIPFPGFRLPFGVHLNVFTAPILLAIAISLLALYLLLCHFDGRIPHSQPEQIAPGKKPLGPDQPPFDRAAVAVCLATRFVVSLSLLNFLTVGPPYVQLAFQWTNEQFVRNKSLILGAIGLHGIAWNLLYVFLDMRKRLSERNAIIGALCLLFAVYLVTYAWPFYEDTIPCLMVDQLASCNSTSATNAANASCAARFDWCGQTSLVNEPLFLGSLVLALGVAVPLSQINLDILYSKVLGRVRQGTMQGVYIVCSDVPSMLLPVVLTRVYEWRGPNPIWSAILCLLCLSLALCTLLYRRMISHSDHNKTTNVVLLTVKQASAKQQP